MKITEIETLPLSVGGGYDYAVSLVLVLTDVIVGAGHGPCVASVRSRENHTYRTADGGSEGTDDWGAYTMDEAALRHGAYVEEETTDANVA